ncbi:MAG: peroxiredoxin [Alphaproteobacteria bacterium]
MTIETGATLPAVTYKYLGDNGMDEGNSSDLLNSGKVVLFALPGAFTPTCSARHLPGFMERADEFAAKGVDRIVCTAVNDPFVMKFWGETAGLDGELELMPDGNADFAGSLGLTFDGSGFGLGTRSQRYAMILEDGVVKHLFLEEPGAFEVSSAEHVLGHL